MAKMLYIGCRVEPEQAEKLAALARQTYRTTADILRLLVDRAVAGDPDISLRAEPMPDVSHPTGVRHATAEVSR